MTTEVLVLYQPLATIPHCGVCGGYATLEMKGSPVCAACHAWYCGVVMEKLGAEKDGKPIATWGWIEA
jgi:hypothetical protein